MGYYIEVPKNLNKAQQIQELYGALEIPRPKNLSYLPADKAIICVVQNGMFDAAAYCYNDGELEAFKEYDGRTKHG
jgi:hypothetical protein